LKRTGCKWEKRNHFKSSSSKPSWPATACNTCRHSRNGYCGVLWTSLHPLLHNL